MGKGTLLWTLAATAAMLAACANAAQDDGAPAPSDDTRDAGSAPRSDAGALPVAKDSGAPPDSDSGAVDDASADANAPPDAGPPALVYGHTSDTLFTFDPQTKAQAKVGPFSGCTQGQVTAVIDLAVDELGGGFVTTFDGFYSVDLTTAQCTLIAKGAYPNSLSFVPKGTLDANEEALVGYSGSSYVRVDPKTGAVTAIGSLSNGYASSGDVVSVKGGGTFLTVTGNGCSDCVLQVNPATGALVQSYGSLGRGAVYGLGYWAGTLYGFDEAGEVFAITGGDGQTATTVTVSTNAQTKWWGAGSTTSAPPRDGDGGAISTL